MATYYFDNTSPIGTAGFGTLTGNWTDLKWSTSSAGTATSGIAWPGAGNEATFGGLSNAAVGGTLTAAAIINLDAITVQNLSTTTNQILTGGTLNFGNVQAPVSVGLNLNLTISSLITGTAGFAKAGAGAIFIPDTAAQSTGLSGTVFFPTSTFGYIRVGTTLSFGNTAINNKLPNVTKYSFGTLLIQPTAQIEFWGGTAYNVTAELEVLTPTTKAGARIFSNNIGATGVTFTHPSVGTFGGTFGAGSAAGTAIVTLPTFPAACERFIWQSNQTAAVVHGAAIVVTPAATGDTNNGVWNILGDTGTAFTCAFTNNATGSSVFTGDVTKTTGNAATTLTLNGTSTSSTLSGDISATLGTIAINKANAGKWILSGANTYTGTTSISAGTLAGNSTSAFGTSAGTTSVITQTGGTLEFGAVVNKGTNAVTLLSLAGATAVSSPTGTTGLTCAGVALSTAATIFDVAAGTFTLTNSAAMSGVGFGISKIGAGEYVIASTVANTFTGAVSVSAGTLTIIGAAAPSSNGPLGNAATGVALTGTMKYAGTGAATISRSMTFTGAAPALEAAGTTSAAAVIFSAFTHAAGARTITFKGDNAGDNTFSAVLNDNGASVVGLTKSGASKWILSAQPTYTGLTTVSAGELQFNELNLANNLTVNGTGKLSKTVLNGLTKTITCDNGTPEIVASTLANTVSGTTSVTGGTLRLTTEVSVLSKPAKVLGTTDVTVSASAAIRTSTGNTQAGKMRYGGNLTFGANSSLYIGG